MAGKLKKTSGGIRAKAGVCAGQGANTCITERKPNRTVTRRDRSTPFSKGVPRQSGSKKDTPKGGQKVRQAPGERVTACG